MRHTTMEDKVTCGHNLCFKNKYDDSHERWDLTNYGPGEGEALKTVKQSYSGLIETGAATADGEGYASFL